jgi:hypothetical protein
MTLERPRILSGAVDGVHGSNPFRVNTHQGWAMGTAQAIVFNGIE